MEIESLDAHEDKGAPPIHDIKRRLLTGIGKQKPTPARTSPSLPVPARLVFGGMGLGGARSIADHRSRGNRKTRGIRSFCARSVPQRRSVGKCL